MTFPISNLWPPIMARHSPTYTCALNAILLSAHLLLLLLTGHEIVEAAEELTDAEVPPNIYKWIEENAHICTIVPADSESFLNFLSPVEGPKCALCPEMSSPRHVPTSACAVELRPNELDVDIGCHPIPELCLLELKTRYADFYEGIGGGIPGGGSRTEEEIFQAAGNPFTSTTTTITTTTTTTTSPQSTATIRADVFSSPNGFPGLPINITMEQIRERSRVGIPLSRVGATLPPLISPAVTGRPSPNGGISIHKRPNADYSDEKNIEEGTRPCTDVHELCCFWATAGECDLNPFWMKVNCAKTCGTCGCKVRNANRCVSTGVACETTTTRISTTTTVTTPTTQKTATPPPTTTAEPTTKRRPFSGREGPIRPPGHRPQRPQGRERSRPMPRTRSTTTTTTTTLTPPPATLTSSSPSTSVTISTTEAEAETTPKGPECLNYNRLCQFWKELGECERNPFWMRPHCQKACQSCGEELEDVFAPVTRPDCLNQHKLCPFWAFIGECARNPRWMMGSCKASCRAC